LEKRFIKPKHRTFTSLINVCVKEGLLEAALKMKNEMIARHIRPDNRTYTSLINVCCQRWLSTKPEEDQGRDARLRRSETG